MKISLVISTYNWPEALRLSLLSLRHQTVMPDEVIIADDGSGPKTAEMIEQIGSTFPIPLHHVWHEDKGFRKTIIMNKAIRQAKGEYIIQIDGDIIMHPYFIEDHISVIEKGYFIRGCRALINRTNTEKYLLMPDSEMKRFNISGDGNTLNSKRIPLLSALFTRESKDILDVKGCNMAYWKEDFVRVNGYNNDIQGWGHEDIELAIRLHNAGVRMKKLKFKGIAFHLEHTHYSRKNERTNKELALFTLSNKTTRAEHGYEQC